MLYLLVSHSTFSCQCAKNPWEHYKVGFFFIIFETDCNNAPSSHAETKGSNTEKQVTHNQGTQAIIFLSSVWWLVRGEKSHWCTQWRSLKALLLSIAKKCSIVSFVVNVLLHFHIQWLFSQKTQQVISQSNWVHEQRKGTQRIYKRTKVLCVPQ